MSRPRVFLDVSVGTDPIGRLILELYTDKTPKTCENFRVLCTGEKPGLTYKMTPFHRIIDEFMIQGGDITKGDGTGGKSIHAGEFADENIGWREIDEAGLLCMANRGKDTNSSQFFITLEACPHLNNKHTVFGRLLSGRDTLDLMAKLKVDKDDRPIDDVFISHCGQLERPKQLTNEEQEDIHMASSHSRGRHKRRRSSASESRSPAPPRCNGRESADEHKQRQRHNERGESSSSRSSSPTPRVRDRKRSDASPDHTLRGRLRHRSRSRTRSPLPAQSVTPPRNYRKRSPPPSRPRSRSRDAEYRRQRSLPNQYRGWRTGDRGGRRDARRDGDYWTGNSSGRLGGGGAWGDDPQPSGDDGIVYKGRGAMKYREQKRRW